MGNRTEEELVISGFGQVWVVQNLFWMGGQAGIYVSILTGT